MMGFQSTNSAKPEQLTAVAGIIQHHLQRDNLPDLQDMLHNGSPQLQPNLESNFPLNFLKQDSFKALPDFMLQQYDSLQVSSFMGIFPEINRVWMTIDNQLFLWNYESDEKSECMNTYEDPDQIIVNVSLVKPIKGIFLEQIEYVLVVSTPLEITLLGIAFLEGKRINEPRTSLTLYETEMTCYADKVNMSNIVGTSNGRIFMRGNDGQLFELVYQSHDGWLTRKIRKINRSTSSVAVFIPSIFNWAGKDPIRMLTVDTERNLLYTVTKKNHIELIDLGEDGMGFNRVSSISDLADQLLKFSAFDDHIVGLYPTLLTESRAIQAVAITTSGHRLYFSTGGYTYQFTRNINSPKYSPPSTLKLRFVLPPPPVNGSMYDKAAKVHESLYLNGLTVAAQALEELDRILIFSPQAGTIIQDQGKKYAEYSSSYELEGRTWAIAELPSRMLFDIDTEKTFPTYFMNELAVQFEYSARKIFLLTNCGLTTLVKMRPVDLLLKIINETHNADVRPYKDFFKVFGADQCCAMALAIACDHPSIGGGQFCIPPNIIDIAVKLYFELGGEPTLKQDSQAPSQLQFTKFQSSLSSTIKGTEYSPKHDGLAMYFARIVRPIWKQLLLQEKKTTSGAIVLDNSMSVESLVSVQLKLQSLGRFLKQYPKLTARPTPDSRPSAIDQEAWKKEQESMANIDDLLQRSIEAISFLSILIDFRFSNVVRCVSDAERKDLLHMTFEDLVVSPKGREIAKTLMTALVNNQIGKELGVESVIDSLQQRCPTICESNDVVMYKGLEHLRNVKSFANQGTAGQHLHEALRLFLTISKHISIAKLGEIVDSFSEFQFYQGVIDLALQKALDYSTPEMQSTPSPEKFEEMNQNRALCYEFVFNSLTNIENLSKPSQSTRTHMSKDDAMRIKNTALARALESNDKTFHFALYSWYIDQNWIDQLLDIKSPYLEEYLWMGRSDLNLADYLSRFFVKQNRFAEAAQLLCDVAHYQGLTLDQRLAFLTSAFTNAKSAVGPSTQELLSQLTDELDVARVQSDILSSLKKIPNADEEISKLNAALMDIGQLFKIARGFYLYEIMLQIFYISDYSGENVQAIIENCWDEICRQALKDGVSQRRSQLESLSDKVKELGRRFYPDESVFPLDFLISKMEFHAMERELGASSDSRGWVVRTMHDIKIPLAQLFNVYHDIFQAKVGQWSTRKALTHLIESIVYLIEFWFEYLKSPAVSSYEKEEFSVRLIDEALSTYLCNVSDDSKVLLSRLHSIQSRIRSAF